jgi:tRNA threonylcarbamoyladenosine biosynthesis protein TsaE
VKHLAKLLSYSGHVTSPTFTLLQTYKGKTSAGSPLYIHHLDLYRLESAEEALLSGIVEPWGEPNSVSLIEWADKETNLLPKNTIGITFTPL